MLMISVAVSFSERKVSVIYTPMVESSGTTVAPSKARELAEITVQ